MKKLILLLFIPLIGFSQQTDLGNISTNQIVFDQNIGFDLFNLETTFLDVSADLRFNVNENDFLLLPGTIPFEGPATPTILMKKKQTMDSRRGL